MKDAMTTPWPPGEPACYGITCCFHAACQRYAAVDNNSNPAQVFTDHCGADTPLFLPVVWLPATALPIVEPKGVPCRPE